jgi:NAD(P)H-dependent FMN reductase
MKIQIIVGSTRTGRVSSRLAAWIANEVKNLDGYEAEILELADYELPFFDEPMPPQYNPERQPVPAVKKWLNKLAEGDAFVIVTPEYNRSTSGVLKNALDYLDFQFKNKPVALVGHGSTGGAQAVASLRGIIAGLKSFTTPSATYVAGRAGELIDESGELVDEEIRKNPYGPQGALQGTLSELKWYADALVAARTRDK